jgi:hypothetical protein
VTNNLVSELACDCCTAIRALLSAARKLAQAILIFLDRDNMMVPGVLAAAVAKRNQQRFPRYAYFILSQNLRRARSKADAASARIKPEQANHQASQSRIEAIHDSSMQVLSDLISITTLQRSRIDRLYLEELRQRRPIRLLNTIIRDYCAQLAQVQKTQFDLGINEFKGPLSGMRGVIDRRTLPDGTHQERHVYEAVATVEDIFRKRGISMEHPELSASVAEEFEP